MKPVLVDTGVMVALLDRSERHHVRCVHAVRAVRSPLVTCEAVIAESCYLLRRLPGAPEAIIENVIAGIVQVPFQLSRDAPAVRKLFHKYRNRSIDLADACLIALAESFETAEILTLDGDFEIYRWGKNKSFRNLVFLN